METAAMKTATEMTEKQQRAVEAMEGARSEGISLSDYAKAHGLVIRELYDAIAGLRRKGLLSPAAKRKRRGKFVAVRVVAEQGLPSAQLSAVGVPVCRVVQPGRVIECLQWPPPNWLAALSPGSADAAS
jgi:hypothetical protein